MKKIIVTGLLAFGLIAVTQQQASAWINSKFSVGLNWNWQTGGNSFLWGLWRDGQPPGPEAFGGHGASPYASPYAAPPFGGMNFGGPPAYPQPVFQSPPPQVQTPPAGGAYQSPYIVDPSNTGGLNQVSPFQFANYPRQVEYYYYPSTGYGNR